MVTYKIISDKGITKTRQLYEALKEDILKGAFSADTRLPSKREMAEHLGISIITVENAYAMLDEEGYIYSLPRSGYYVNELPVDANKRNKMRSMQYLPEEKADENIVKIPGMERMVRKVLSDKPEILQMRSPHFGCGKLRNVIAEYLRRARGMDVLPSHIIIGSGAEYLYGLTVQLFGRDVSYGIEYPSYEKIELIYKANGAKTVRLKMGNDGIKESSLQRTKAKVLHVTPFHSYPTGVTASAKKRYAYLEWAKDNDGYLIEDDFDSEYAFFKKPIDTLFSMDKDERVLYMNTFTKSISPSIRIAYLVLPDRLLERYKQKLGFYSCTVPVFDQYILAEFIKEGAFERHLGRIRRKIKSQR